MTKPNQDRIDAAMLGDAEAAREFSLIEYAIPCAACFGEKIELRSGRNTLWLECKKCGNKSNWVAEFESNPTYRLHSNWNTRADLRHLARPRWIPVEERLPSKLIRVLMLMDRISVYEGWLMFGGKWLRMGGLAEGALGTKVTHWMSLPQAPEEEADLCRNTDCPYHTDKPCEAADGCFGHMNGEEANHD